MSRICFFLFFGSLIVAGAALWEPRLDAQEEPKFEAVKTIVTADGVKLNAAFYPSAKKNAATVILLHPVGEGKSMRLPGWKALAETLQKNGLSVFMFDFRGHGDSTTIEPTDFWKFPSNRSFVRKSTKDGDSIDVKDYIKNSGGYLPVLVNDIAAVKAYLDRKNDGGGCNTANTIVIGAENGGTLGAIWINSEWQRYKATQDMFGRVMIDKRAEGNDIIGAVWLSIAPSLGTRKVSIPAMLNVACKQKLMPTVFLYGGKETGGKTLNKAIVDSLRLKGSKKTDVIVHAEVPDTSLSGAKLLNKDLKTDDFIAKYLVDEVLTVRNNEWEDRKFSESTYMWKSATGVLAPAKTKMEKSFRFDTYEKFMQ